jgi:uncharacterized protein
VQQGSELFGRGFEHFIFNELLAHSRYSEKFYPITYWKTTSGFEVDFVLADHETAIEVKSSNETKPRHLKGLRAFKEEFKVKNSIVVSLDPRPRKTGDNILILPWNDFLKKLWRNEIQ